MKTVLSWSLTCVMVATSHLAHANCFSEARDCQSDAMEKRTDCLAVCDADDSDCKHECRVDYLRDKEECEQTRAQCLADERTSEDQSSPGVELRQPSLVAPPTIYYQMVSPPLYAPNGAMVQRPVYQAFQMQPNSGMPVPLNPGTTPGQCPSGAYIYRGGHGTPPSFNPKQLYPVPPNALCK